MPGGGAEVGVKADQAVVGAGLIVCGGDADGGSGVGTDGRVGGDEQDGDGDGLSRWEDNVAHITLGTETNDPLAYTT